MCYEVVPTCSSQTTESTTISNGLLPLEDQANAEEVKVLEDEVFWQTLDHMALEFVKSRQRELSNLLELQRRRITTASQGVESPDSPDPYPERSSLAAHSGLEDINMDCINTTKSKKIADLEAQVAQLQIDVLALEEKNRNLQVKLTQGREPRSVHGAGACATQDHTPNKAPNSRSGSTVTLLAQLMRDKSVLLDHIQQLQKDNEKLFKTMVEQFKKQKGEVAKDTEKPEVLQHQPAPHCFLDLNREGEGRNTDSPVQIRDLWVTVQTLKDENSKYKEENKMLVEERNNLQIRLTVSRAESRTCMNALKKKSREYEDLKSQVDVLQKEIHHHHRENEDLKKRLVELLNENLNAKDALISTGQKSNSIIQARTSYRQNASLPACDIPRVVPTAPPFVEEKECSKDQHQNKRSPPKAEYGHSSEAFQHVRANSIKQDLGLQEYACARESSGREIEQVERCIRNAEENLHVEQNAIAQMHNILGNRSVDKSQQIWELSKLVADLQNKNAFLKEELKECIKANVKFDRAVKTISKEKHVLDNYTRVVESERDALQIEVQRIYSDWTQRRDPKNVIHLNTQRNGAIEKWPSQEGHKRVNEMAVCQRNAVEHQPEGHDRLTHIQRRLDRHLEEMQNGNDGVERYRALSIRETTSVIQDPTRTPNGHTDQPAAQPPWSMEHRASYGAHP
ncbi:coiled-coil domain-containing protein 110 [Ambystoma mexicanum]|uniref:coiled-coil domain-containing protein 110 n=1 Tax=Ambystoma mexicanum TaxID=8296 RepID=UPI0037E74686